MDDILEIEDDNFDNKIDECPIVSEMASLDLIDESPKPANRRSLRRRSGLFQHSLIKKALEDESSPVTLTKAPKRRVKNKPKKCSKLNEDQFSSDIKDYYLCKKFKRMPSSFETIYEEPKLQKNRVVFVANKKEKRLLSFAHSSTGKVKKRRIKIKKLLPNQNYTKRKRLSMDYFLKKIGNCDQNASTESPQ